MNRNIRLGIASSSLPSEFKRALRASGSEERLCVVSRVAFDELGRVHAVEWGVMDGSFHCWHAGPGVALVDASIQAIESGAEVFAIFPTPTGFAFGGKLEVCSFADGRLSLKTASSWWDIESMAQLNLKPPDLENELDATIALPAQKRSTAA